MRGQTYIFCTGDTRMSQETKSTIRFNAQFAALLTLPETASAQLPSKGITTVEGTINGYPFRAPLESDGKGSHSLKVTKALRDAAGAEPGEAVTVEITRIEEEPEIRMPPELTKALAVSPPAQKLWTEITPIARRDWILWMTSAKQPETRLIRIEKACSMLASGKRRVCCFGGLNWLTKDHPTVDTWLPLPTTKDLPSPKSTKQKQHKP